MDWVVEDESGIYMYMGESMLCLEEEQVDMGGFDTAN